MDLRLLPAYGKGVVRHGWWVLLAVLGGVGDLATVLGDFEVPRWIWYSLIAVGVLAAQFGAYCDVKAELATVRGRLRELDTDEAKRAYLDEQIARAEGLQRRIKSAPEDRWFALRRTYGADITHWEDVVRADLRESFPGDLDILFDSDEGFGPGPSGVVLGTPEYEVHYLERRLTRLRQIKEEL